MCGALASDWNVYSPGDCRPVCDVHVQTIRGEPSPQGGSATAPAKASRFKVGDVVECVNCEPPARHGEDILDALNFGCYYEIYLLGNASSNVGEPFGEALVKL